MNIPSPRRKLLEAYLSEDPQNESLMLDLAGECFGEKDYERALALATSVQRLNPDNAKASAMELLSLLALGRKTQAEASLRAALPRARTTTEARQLLWPFARFGKTKDGLTVVDALLRQGAMVDDTQLALLRAMYFAGDPRRALVRLLELVAHREPTPEHDALAALLYFDTQQLDMARVYLARCSSADYESVETLYVSASLIGLDGELADAIAQTDRAIAMSPTEGRCVALKGQFLMAAGRLGEALPQLLRATELMPEHVGSWLAVGWCHFFQGDPVEARRAFSHALQLDHNFAESHGAMAVVDASEGRIALAEESAKRAVRIDRNNLSARLARLILEKRKDAPPGALHEMVMAELKKLSAPQGGSLQQLVQRFINRQTSGTNTRSEEK
jgi:tetratricopeptide (TPR) repeat protein